MKFQMAKNSLFAVLLRSSWWISALIAVVLGLAGFALLPDQFRVAGALSGLPFAVIGTMAAWRQSRRPSAARIAQTQQALAAMDWPAFGKLLELAFQRDGYVVQRGKVAGVDFELERQGRRMLVCARRWKSAHTALSVLRALQEVRDATDTPDALYIGLGPLTDTAQPFARQNGIVVWQASELAHTLRGLPLGPAKAR